MTSKAVLVQGKRKTSTTVTARDFSNEVTLPDLLGLTSAAVETTQADENPIGVSRLLAETERVLSNYDLTSICPATTSPQTS
jgi:hypothetical protein